MLLYLRCMLWNRTGRTGFVSFLLASYFLVAIVLKTGHPDPYAVGVALLGLAFSVITARNGARSYKRFRPLLDQFGPEPFRKFATDDRDHCPSIGCKLAIRDYEKARRG